MLPLPNQIVTYSPAYTLVPTYECFNKCTYCNFRSDIGSHPWMTLEQAEKILFSLKGQGICEILILSGEVHPLSSRRQEWLDLIYDLCVLALSMGFLPHTNAGILSFSEMQRLKNVNASMGLMLEQLTPKLLHTVHRHAPSKIPELRLQHLQWAGELQIPFTTGLLLGIGENEDDRRQTLMAITDLHLKYQNIQEVILQPHSPGSEQTFDEVAFDPYQLPRVIAQAREILPSDITIQIPPNLVPEENWLLACLDAGARDLGGIGPRDEVNPDYPHREVNRLREVLLSGGWILLPRLPVYKRTHSVLGAMVFS
ncbi:MAG: 7,8-didemethyl-8-hydroxy-5-deazariboflavin synthase subunit CofG [Cyanobacteria bacterium REEB494]|uniref:7,8-didemethyl-8-hydroxy-5-deazariboflavin synthase subunit CofG n=1 Tax=Cylindrospermopsis raciborskii TaxID=77022 RepID=UPI002EDA0F41|nr:7,8-didemethyl-8-hydroxy-5-deazariboflavin synthase subunit CofG [Cyanobacteria bacterium REEB494]